MPLIHIKNNVYQFLHERGSIERTGTVTRDAELTTHQRSTTQEVYKVEGVHGHLPAAPLYLDRLLNILCFSLSLSPPLLSLSLSLSLSVSLSKRPM